jgi:hypothetical protein
MKMDIVTSRSGRFAALGVCGMISVLFAQPGLASPSAVQTASDPVHQIAAQAGEPGSAATYQWASNLDVFAQGLAKLLRDPAALATLQGRIAASPLPESTVRLEDLLGVQVQGQRDRFGALLAKQAGITEGELRAALAGFPRPITLFFPREADRQAVLTGKSRGRVDLQVTWDSFWIPQGSLRTLLAYDHTGRRTRYPVAKPPAGPVLVVSTENSAQPEAPHLDVDVATETGAAAEATCYSPYLELTGIYLVGDHEGWPRGEPEFELYLADWNTSMPGNQLLIRPTTPYQFSGRNITDAAGRSRYLLDVNDTGKWYTFNPPIAMFEYNPFLGNGLYAVEDDSTAGVLKVTGSYSIGFTCSYFPGCTGPQCSGCDPNGSGLVNLARAIFGSGDDRFDIPFRSVGQAPMDTIMEASMGDWRLRYRVACP